MSVLGLDPFVDDLKLGFVNSEEVHKELGTVQGILVLKLRFFSHLDLSLLRFVLNEDRLVGNFLFFLITRGIEILKGFLLFLFLLGFSDILKGSLDSFLDGIFFIDLWLTFLLRALSLLEHILGNIEHVLDRVSALGVVGLAHHGSDSLHDIVEVDLGSVVRVSLGIDLLRRSDHGHSRLEKILDLTLVLSEHW